VAVAVAVRALVARRRHGLPPSQIYRETPFARCRRRAVPGFHQRKQEGKRSPEGAPVTATWKVQWNSPAWTIVIATRTARSAENKATPRFARFGGITAGVLAALDERSLSQLGPRSRRRHARRSHRAPFVNRTPSPSDHFADKETDKCGDSYGGPGIFLNAGFHIFFKRC
jgi:hypothetical protein